MKPSERIDLVDPCAHAEAITIKSVKRPAKGCEDCLKIAGSWLHLRVCLTCGHVACCDSSPNRHASAHARANAHPIITSAEVGETWAYCYIDDTTL